MYKDVYPLILCFFLKEYFGGNCPLSVVYLDISQITNILTYNENKTIKL